MKGHKVRVAKVVIGKREKFVEVLKVSSVKFDPRPDWVFVKELDRTFGDVCWMHPDEVRFEWIREFSK